MGRARKTAAWLVLVVPVALQGCGAAQNRAADRVDGSADEVEAATARGLAASVLDHLDPDEVVDVEGAQHGRHLSAFIATSDPAIQSIYVSVAEPAQGQDRCGGDWGFEQVSCTPGANFSEVVARKGAGPMPVYLGRAQTAARGHVLVMIHGEPSDAVLTLIDELVRDPLIGFRTSKALNLEGESIADFGELKTQVEVAEVTP